jgi:hypothetical protein
MAIKINNSSKKKTPEKKICVKCSKEKTLPNFYMSNSPNYPDKRHPVCSNCLKENFQFDSNTDYKGKDVIDRVKSVLLELNRPFLYEIWDSATLETNKTSKDVFGIYMRILMIKHKDHTWQDGDFHDENAVFQKDIEKPSEETPLEDFITPQLVDKWGEGYTPDEYRSFERKYQMLKNNYQEKTAMHTEALLTYIRYQVKGELATAKGDIRAAKDWGSLAQKAAQDAKINPSQLSKSDLSDGLDTFGQLVRSVEQAIDIIPILPKFRSRPQDKVDFTLLCYINYVRDLKGLPLATYDEIYSFYDQRKKDFESSTGDLDGEL